MLRDPPQRRREAALGPCQGRAPLLVRQLQAAGRHLEKVACSWPGRRGLGTAPGSSHPLRGGAPGLADRRDQGKAVLASKGHSRGLYLRGQRVQESLDRIKGTTTLNILRGRHPSSSHRNTV